MAVKILKIFFWNFFWPLVFFKVVFVNRKSVPVTTELFLSSPKKSVQLAVLSAKYSFFYFDIEIFNFFLSVFFCNFGSLWYLITLF